MCLNNAVRIRQTKDIVCYKVLRIYKDSVMFSPYYTAKSWKLGKTETLRRNAPDMTVYEDGIRKIHGGAYHSYINVNEIEKAYFIDSRYAVCKCIIPKNSKYVYKGISSNGTQGYASQKLKPIEILKLDENDETVASTDIIKRYSINNHLTIETY
jgi:predicted small secreted protein